MGCGSSAPKRVVPLSATGPKDLTKGVGGGGGGGGGHHPAPPASGTTSGGLPLSTMTKSNLSKNAAQATILQPSLRLLNERYRISDEVMGKGGFGEVRKAVRVSDGKEVGIKIISKMAFQGEEERKLMLDEANMHKLVSGHRHITELYEWMEDPGNFYMCMELALGGELMERIISMHHFTERKAAGYFQQMAEGLSHVHSKLVVHRDLKPENFLLESHEEGAQIKITDFGLSTVLPTPDAVLTDPCGSAFYIAPEIFRRSYTAAVDVWSLGVILYLLLSGNVPFGATAKTEQEVYASIQKDPLVFGPEWNQISGSARELLSGLLEKNPAKRYTLAQALAHPWVAGGAASDNRLNTALLQSLKSFNAQNKFKKEALKLVASSLTATDVRELRAAFHKIDKDNTGFLSYAEMQEALEEMGIKGDSATTADIMKNIDADGDGQISYEEFLVAALDRKLLEYQKNIWWAFCKYDLNGDGKITAEELKQVLHKETRESLANIIAEYDQNGDGEIDYREFMMMLLPKDLKDKVKIRPQV